MKCNLCGLEKEIRTEMGTVLYFLTSSKKKFRVTSSGLREKTTPVRYHRSRDKK